MPDDIAPTPARGANRISVHRSGGVCALDMRGMSTDPSTYAQFAEYVSRRVAAHKKPVNANDPKIVDIYGITYNAQDATMLAPTEVVCAGPVDYPAYYASSYLMHRYGTLLSTALAVSLDSAGLTQAVAQQIVDRKCNIMSKYPDGGYTRYVTAAAVANKYFVATLTSDGSRYVADMRAADTCSEGIDMLYRGIYGKNIVCAGDAREKVAGKIARSKACVTACFFDETRVFRNTEQLNFLGSIPCDGDVRDAPPWGELVIRARDRALALRASAASAASDAFVVEDGPRSAADDADHATACERIAALDAIGERNVPSDAVPTETSEALELASDAEHDGKCDDVGAAPPPEAPADGGSRPRNRIIGKNAHVPSITLGLHFDQQHGTCLLWKNSDGTVAPANATLPLPKQVMNLLHEITNTQAIEYTVFSNLLPTLVYSSPLYALLSTDRSTGVPLLTDWAVVFRSYYAVLAGLLLVVESSDKKEEYDHHQEVYDIETRLTAVHVGLDAAYIPEAKPRLAEKAPRTENQPFDKKRLEQVFVATVKKADEYVAHEMEKILACAQQWYDVLLQTHESMQTQVLLSHQSLQSFSVHMHATVVGMLRIYEQAVMSLFPAAFDTENMREFYLTPTMQPNIALASTYNKTVLANAVKKCILLREARAGIVSPHAVYVLNTETCSLTEERTFANNGFLIQRYREICVANGLCDSADASVEDAPADASADVPGEQPAGDSDTAGDAPAPAHAPAAATVETSENDRYTGIFGLYFKLYDEIAKKAVGQLCPCTHSNNL